MNILITGGFGFIGMYTARKLLAEGHAVWIFDTLPVPPSGQEAFFTGASFIRGDLLAPISLLEAIENHRIERLVHLAAFRNNDCQQNPYLAFQLNCEGLMNCFEAARIRRLERVVYTSSTAVLGNFSFYKKLGIDIHSLKEDAPGNPDNVYGVTKLFDELMGLQYIKRYKMKIVGVRLPVVFGAGKKGGSRTSFFNEMIELPCRGEPVEVRAIPAEKFGIQYVKDAAKAVVCGCLSEDTAGGVYNTGAAIVNISEYAEAIRKVLPRANIRIVEDPQALLKNDSCMDSSLAESELGYSSDFTLEEGIEDHVKAIMDSIQGG